MDIIIQPVIILLILSLITEKVSNFIKLQFENLSHKKSNRQEERSREKQIQNLTLIVGIAVALLTKANLFLMFKEEFELFWTTSDNEDLLSNLVGSFMAGVFLSLGSKFFHDLLDMLLQVKNLKRKLNDKKDWEFDTIEEVDNYLESNDIVQLKTFLTNKFSNIEGFNYYEIDYRNQIITVYVQTGAAVIPTALPYKTLYGKTKLFKVYRVENKQPVRTMAFTINPSDEIANRINPRELRGSISYPVKRKDDGKNLILTCYHAVWTEGCNWSVFIPKNNIEKVVHPKGGQVIGKIVSAVKNRWFDVALIDPISQIDFGFEIPFLKIPDGIRQLFKQDVETKTQVSVYSISNTQGTTYGFVDGIEIDVEEIEYPDGSLRGLGNLIKIKSYNDEPFSIPGDSGSIVVDQWNYAIGIVVAGHDNVTFLIPITTIFQSLNLNI